MNRCSWYLRLLLRLSLLTGGSMALLLYSPQFNSTVQTLQTWLEQNNPWADTSPFLAFVGTGLNKPDPEIIPTPKDLVALAFPEERTECTGDSKNLPTLPLRSIPPEFKKCVAEIYAQTQVPILLPTKFTSKWAENYILYNYIKEKPRGDYQYKGSLGYIEYQGSQGYSIALTRFPGNYHLEEVGFVVGKKITSHTPTLKALSRADALEKHVLLGSFVTLLSGRFGYYFPARCDKSCIDSSFSRIVWEQNGCQYEIGLKMGRREDVIEMANSAIENQL